METATRTRPQSSIELPRLDSRPVNPRDPFGLDETPQEVAARRAAYEQAETARRERNSRRVAAVQAEARARIEADEARRLRQLEEVRSDMRRDGHDPDDRPGLYVGAARHRSHVDDFDLPSPAELRELDRRGLLA